MRRLAINAEFSIIHTLEGSETHVPEGQGDFGLLCKEINVVLARLTFIDWCSSGFHLTHKEGSLCSSSKQGSAPDEVWGSQQALNRLD